MKMIDREKFHLDMMQNDPLVRQVWHDKYRLIDANGRSDELDQAASRARVVRAVYAKDPIEAARLKAMHMVQDGYVQPAGRINAGAGTDRAVTLINCYVQGTVQDSMPGIQYSIARGAFTMQAGGGIGTDFSTIRPWGALVGRTGSMSTGAIPFMDEQDAMCRTVKSAASRRGAMMGCLSCDHPDLWNDEQYETIIDSGTKELVLKRPSFISAKRQKGRLTGFNVSVLVTEQFMQAVAKDADWDLGFHIPRADGNHVAVYNKPFPYDEHELGNELTGLSPEALGRPFYKKGDMLPWFVYTRVKARTVWEDIMQSTYVYAEPGVIFIDRINQRNNLYYCEQISATNPCGEQPLPPDGACDLTSICLAFMVTEPFTNNARFDYEKLHKAVMTGMRFVDNVLDVTKYPLEAQRIESMNKRRVGLGPTGWGDTLVQMGMTYGSPESLKFCRQVAEMFKLFSYEASCKLAKERGPFPLYDRDKFLAGYNAASLPDQLKEQIAEHGIRNGVCNTIAPNGTIALYNWNVSGGHEPVYSFDPFNRTIRQPDGSGVDFEVKPYSYKLYEAIHGPTPRDKLPPYFVGAVDISPTAHVMMHAAWQTFIDASISKTINCPTEMTYEDFKHVYDMAYRMECKGCTTYRPDPKSGRGSVLALVAPVEAQVTEPTSGPVSPRPRIVDGRTFKLKWPPTSENWYITINHDQNGPFEVFIVAQAAQHSEWVQAMSRLLTAVLRRGGDVRFLINELTAVHSAHGGAFIPDQRRFRPSVIAAIGGVVEEEFRALGLLGDEKSEPVPFSAPRVVDVTVTRGQGADSCPDCGATPLVHEQGCLRCIACDYNKCT